MLTIPAQPLLKSLPSRAVLVTGPLGCREAAQEDLEGWIRGFKGLLEGLSEPLQVVIRSSGGSLESDIFPDREQKMPLPPTLEARRQLDLEFIRQLRSSSRARRQQILMVTSPKVRDNLEQALSEIGLPVQSASNNLELHLERGMEAPSWWWDSRGLQRSWYLERFPGSELEPGWLHRLIPPGLEICLSWHAYRLPSEWVVNYLQRQRIRMQAAELITSEVGDPHIAGALPAAEELQRKVAAYEESAFHVALYLTVLAHGPKELDEASRQIERAARSTLCVLHRCTYRQREGRVATLPLGVDPLARHRVLDTSSLATLWPWFDAELQQPSGWVVGVSQSTQQPVVIDPFDEKRYANANIGIFGHSGAGKTYLLSSLAMGAQASGAQVFLLDPEHEYGRLARRLGGLDVQLRLGSAHSLNVLELAGLERDEASLGPVVADALDLCDVLCGGLEEAERADLEAVIRATFAERAEPLLSDVALRLRPDFRVGRVLRRWSQGSLGAMFSRPTNIDLNSSLVVFGMRELRPELVAPVHFLLTEALWAQIRRRDRRRLLIIDELGLLFEEPLMRRMVVALARRIRKYGGALVFATQNPGDLLSSEAGAVVATNPAIHFFGFHRSGEAARLQEHFQLSKRQRMVLERARRGEFLLSAGADKIPLQVRIPPWQADILRR